MRIWIDPQSASRLGSVCLPIGQCLKEVIIESKVLDQILADYHGPGFGEDQVLLGITFHAGGATTTATPN